MTDFDFLIGSWNVHNRRLIHRFVDSAEWEEFPGISTSTGGFDGAANYDEIVFPTKGIRGLTLRLFDQKTRQWSLYWASSSDGTLTPPVVGSYGPDGRGEFFGADTADGRPVRVRFIWSAITERSARWEQAFSIDGEQTWETNWIMDFARRSIG